MTICIERERDDHDDLLLLLRLRTGAHEDEDRVFIIIIIILFKVILRHNILWSILCGIFREGEEDLGQEELELSRVPSH